MKKNTTYKDTGVDLKEIRYSHESLAKIFKETINFPLTGKVLSGFGHYAGLFQVNSKTFAFHTDGVGTKILVAQALEKFDTIGIDCVAMNVNDIICVGATPLCLTDYLAIRKPDKKIVTEIAKGLRKGAEESSVAIIGGETAIIPDLLTDNQENAFDLAATVFGMVEGKEPILGNNIEVGDIVLGVESSGIHSNGLTLARKVLLADNALFDQCKFTNSSIGEELLRPTRIYVKPVLEILKRNITVKGIAHITGGAFSKLLRLSHKLIYNLNSFPEIHGIFKQIQEEGNVPDKEMYKTFNMGIGLCVVVTKASEKDVIGIFKKHEMTCHRIGEIQPGRIGKVIINIRDKNIVL